MARSPLPPPPPPPPVRTTRCSLRRLELLSVRQVQDQHAAAPCVMRVRARLVRVLPRESLLWTCAQPADGVGGGVGGGVGAAARFSYRMVLQLEDVDAEAAWLGALLLDEQAEAFFGDLPATDLHRDELSRSRLEAAVEGLLAARTPLELGLVSYRPDPNDSRETGVAYRIVSTALCAGDATDALP